MPEILESRRRATFTETLRDEVARVCHRIPPLWDLRNYVAVNPFLGFTGTPMAEAAQEVGDGLGARVLPALDHYRERWREGAFGPEDLAQAASRSGHDPATLQAILEGRQEIPERASSPVLTFAERHDRRHGTEWNDAVVRQIARWCAVHASGGGSVWKIAEKKGLYASWLDAARVDRSLEIAGLVGWRSWARTLPERPEQAIDVMVARLGVRAPDREAYLYRLLGGVYGWASYLRRSSWSCGDSGAGDVADLLAIRVCGDAAVASLAGEEPRGDDEPEPCFVEDEAVRMVLQDALETGFARPILRSFASPSPGRNATRPDVQAVFCIDVRSEPMRRHLESQSSTIETLGFAGFFGVSLDWRGDGHGSARCPVLLKPGVRLGSDASGSETAIAPAGAAKALQLAPASAFSFVEMLGLAYGVILAGDAIAARPSPRSAEETARIDLEPRGDVTGIPLSQRLDIASAILKNMGLRSSFAKIVLLCGHAGRSANNPHAAGLDCGACGGHGGAINARVAAAVLNDPHVRDGLTGRGWNVPADTHFLPGVHDTTTDTVTLMDIEQVPPGSREDLERLRGWLAKAGDQVRIERAPALGLGAKPGRFLGRLLRRRARDWSEVRPEWALAGNAPFIAARRERTRGVDLGGRAFLHEYDASTDEDNSILSMILSAPMVVGSWINLQYFASTVDNDVFGCGTKAIHNRVGTLGVVLGNGGDLRTGLAIQSVHQADGRWYHKPLRLQVIVEAETWRIDEVLAAQDGVRDLVENGWVRLFAISPEASETSLWVPGQGWRGV